MNPIEIIERFYDPSTDLFKILVDHSNSVTEKALDVVMAHPEFEADAEFIAEAAMLHDIGIIQTDAPKIQCFGKNEYICHGYLGRQMLDKLGFPRHALVCERHTGAGISLEQIEKEKLPIPHREMIPVTIEEKIICYADKFYGKTKLDYCKTYEEALKSVSKYGADSASRFIEMHKLFS